MFEGKVMATKVQVLCVLYQNMRLCVVTLLGYSDMVLALAVSGERLFSGTKVKTISCRLLG